MFRWFFVGVLFTLAIEAACGYGVLRAGVIPVNADATPGPFEKFVAQTSLRATLNRDAPKGDGPIPVTEANLVDGIRLYGQNCAICHGLSDSAPSSIAKGEYPKPPQLAKHGVEDDPVGWTFWKIKNGVRWTGMPSWKPDLNDDEMWRLALFLKHMDHLPPAADVAWRALKRPSKAAQQPPAASTPAASHAAP